MKRLSEVIRDCNDDRIAWLEERARFDPIVASWLHTWRFLEVSPSIGDLVGLVQIFAMRFDQAQAAALRAAQVRPVSLQVECAATSCELRKALEKSKPPIVQL
jgi:hypothetical protein